MESVLYLLVRVKPHVSKHSAVEVSSEVSYTAKRFAKGFAAERLGLGTLWLSGGSVLCPGWPFSFERRGRLHVEGLVPQGIPSRCHSGKPVIPQSTVGAACW